MTFQKAEPRELKKILQSHFNHPFSVRRDRGTASHWIQVRWEDGPKSEDVRMFLGKFNDTKNDDPMTDLWCGSQYTSESRDYSLRAFVWAAEQVEKELGIRLRVTEHTDWEGKQRGYINHTDDVLLDGSSIPYASQIVNRRLYETDFRKVFKKPALESIQKANGKEVRENKEKNGVEILFDQKPSDQILIKLKANGWRWFRFNRVWYNRLTPENLEFAKSL